MKKRKVSAPLFKGISILPLVLMFTALVFAYISNVQFDKPNRGNGLGTVSTDVSWRARLKDNPFFPTNELGSDYFFIKELVDQLQFDLKFNLTGAPADAAVKINYRVDGVLQVNSDAIGNGLLLTLELPKLADGTAELSQESADNVQEFELPLAKLTYPIENFQSAYRIGVKSKMDLKINIDSVLESGGKSIKKSLPFALTIPLDSNVFQISGSPSDKIEFTAPEKSEVQAEGGYGTTLYYLGTAVLMLLVTIAVFLFFSPCDPAPEMAMLKRMMQKCKGNLVTIKSNPRDAGLQMLPVADMEGLINISESTGQPVLYYNEKDDHLFLVSSDGILYSYELQAVGQAEPGHVPTQGNTACCP